MAEVIERASILAALKDYRARLKEEGQLLKMMAVDRCIAIVRQI